jgi:hypothetical protein
VVSLASLVVLVGVVNWRVDEFDELASWRV